jgi:mono/diheme cytochrome c family protein
MKSLHLLMLAMIMIPLPLWAVDGKSIYMRECAACHGRDGSAQTKLGKRLKPPARDLRPKILSSKEIRRVILLGRKKTGMHARKERLTDDEISALVTFILSLPYTANPANGRRIFAGKCARCHGKHATGQGLPKAPNLLLSELSDIAMAEIIRHGHPGTVMGGMKAELSNADIADMIAWLRLLRYGLDH